MAEIQYKMTLKFITCRCYALLLGNKTKDRDSFVKRSRGDTIQFGLLKNLEFWANLRSKSYKSETCSHFAMLHWLQNNRKPKINRRKFNKSFLPHLLNILTKS